MADPNEYKYVPQGEDRERYLEALRAVRKAGNTTLERALLSRLGGVPLPFEDPFNDAHPEVRDLFD